MFVILLISISCSRTLVRQELKGENGLLNGRVKKESISKFIQMDDNISVEKLLDKEEVELYDSRGLNLLHQAVEANAPKVVKLLLDRRDKLQFSITDHIDDGDTETPVFKERGYTALHIAAEKLYVGVLTLLLEALQREKKSPLEGVDIKTYEGSTPFHVVPLDLEDVSIIDLLRKYGANLSEPVSKKEAEEFDKKVEALLKERNIYEDEDTLFDI